MPRSSTTCGSSPYPRSVGCAPEARARSTWSEAMRATSRAAQAAAVEALKYQDEVERRVTQTLAARLDLEEGVRALGLWVAESDANFIWLRLPDGVEERDVVSGLRERGVLVRAGASLGSEGALRVTVGTPGENERFVRALGELVRR